MIQDRSNLAQQLYQAWTFESDFHNKHCSTARERTLVSIRSCASPDVVMHAHGPFWNVYRTLFVYCVETSLVLQAIAVVIVWNNSDTVPQRADDRTLISLAVCQVVQALVLGVVLKHTFYMIVNHVPSMKRIGQTYLAVIVAFSGFHLMTFTISPSSYHIVANRPTNHLTLGQSLIGLVYYSVATISSTGFGDVYALQWPGQTLAALQMCLGTLYNIGIFAILCSHFQSVVDLAESQLRRQYARRHRNLLQRLFKAMRTHIPGLERCRKLLIRQLAAFVLCTSLLSLAIIKLVIGDETQLMMSASSRTTVYALALIGLVQAAVIISMSVRVVQKIHVNYIDFSFLLQSVLSTILIFAHFYLLLSLAQGNLAFRIASLSDDGTPASLEHRAWTLLFFSTVVQSTTGYGDVWAISSSARILVTLHMLISTLYAVAVVGLGISRIMTVGDGAGRTPPRRRTSFDSGCAVGDQYQILVDHPSELLI